MSNQAITKVPWVPNKFLVEKDVFVDGFLKPLSLFDLPDKCCRISYETDSISGITYTNDRNCILHATYKNIKSDVFEPIVLRDINRLISAISFVSEPQMIFTLNENYIEYDSSSIKFKSYYLDNNFFDSKIKQKLDKIKELEVNSTFHISPIILSKIKKSKSFAKSTNKVYFYSNDSKVYVSRHDSQKNNIDVMSFLVSDNIYGKKFDEIPIHISIFDLICDLNSTIIVELNEEYGIVKFKLENDKSKLEYITSTLRK